MVEVIINLFMNDKRKRFLFDSDLYSETVFRNLAGEEWCDLHVVVADDEFAEAMRPYFSDEAIEHFYKDYDGCAVDLDELFSHYYEFNEDEMIGYLGYSLWGDINEKKGRERKIMLSELDIVELSNGNFLVYK